MVKTIKVVFKCILKRLIVFFIRDLVQTSDIISTFLWRFYFQIFIALSNKVLLRIIMIVFLINT